MQQQRSVCLRPGIVRKWVLRHGHLRAVRFTEQLAVRRRRRGMSHVHRRENVHHQRAVLVSAKGNARLAEMTHSRPLSATRC
jgi:hypothetical protein